MRSRNLTLLRPTKKTIAVARPRGWLDDGGRGLPFSRLRVGPDRQSPITVTCCRCWMKGDDQSARSVLVVLFRVASGAGSSPFASETNLVVTQGSPISPTTCSRLSPHHAVQSGRCVIGPPFSALHRFHSMSRSAAYARFTCQSRQAGCAGFPADLERAHLQLSKLDEPDAVSPGHAV